MTCTDPAHLRPMDPAHLRPARTLAVQISSRGTRSRLGGLTGPQGRARLLPAGEDARPACRIWAPGTRLLGYEWQRVGETCRSETVRGKQPPREDVAQEGGVRGPVMPSWHGRASGLRAARAAQLRVVPTDLALSVSRWEPGCAGATGPEQLEPALGGAGFKSVEKETPHFEAHGP